MKSKDLQVHGKHKTKDLLDADPIKATLIIGCNTYSIHGMGYGKDSELKGRGCFGRVFIGKDQNEHPVAIKITKKPKVIFPDERGKLNLEIRIQRELNRVSPYILGAKAAGEYKDMFFIVMDQASSGDLYEFVNSSSKNKHYRRELLQYVRDAANGLEDLHSINIIHGDLKLENIICHDGKGMLIDFGFSNYLDLNRGIYLSGNTLGSLGHIAPEVVSRRLKSTKTDVFAFGALMYNAFANRDIPGADKLTPDVLNIPWGNFEKKNGSNLTILLKRCLAIEPFRRPSIEEVRKKLDSLLNRP